ncbi:MAG: AAA family ATPase [Armatimonadetes bacterium]|jgi:Cdc6-like AAA superfamily ATPase|nr:AAA family ATPase [Armatimonadota bacterium]
MQFKNVKASELGDRVELPGLAEWIERLRGDEAAILIAAPAGTGKTAAVGAIARQVQRDVMQCDLLQVFEYPDSHEALRSILTIAENLRATVFQADGFDRLVERLQEAGDSAALDELRGWLADKKERLRSFKVTFVATGRQLEVLPADLRAQFDATFPA